MKTHWEIDDKQFELEFEDGIFPVAAFSHEAHLRLAWIHINCYGEPQAIENITGQIKKYVAIHGASDKYHETLTIAAIKTVNHFYQKSQKASFKDFITSFPRMKDNFRELIDAHYSSERISSPEAKSKFVEPDLQEYC